LLIEKIGIENINPAVYNPRKDLRPGDVEYEKLKKSIAEFDIVEPLVWNKRSGNLVGGHQRLKILKELGYKEVEVSVVDLTDSKEKALNLALNKISGEWDFPLLKDILEEINTGEFDIEITGFDDKEIEDLMTKYYEPTDGLTDDDAIPEQVPTICKKGDLWQLGEHRLLCGDATVITDVERLMGGEKADMVFTDPPYGVDYDGTHLSSGTYFGKGQRESEKLENDTHDIYGEAMPILYSFLKDDKVSAYICFAGAFGKTVFDAVSESGFTVRALLIWNKNHAQFGSMGSQYKQKHEPILYLFKKGKTTQWFGANNEVTVWDIDRQSKNEFHLTQKPVALSERAINNSSGINDLVLDLFGGSGSTLIACEKLSRKCRMMEIDEHYCDVIIKRWEDFTGNKAELEEKE
jgi:DNA modification methylase